MSMCGHVDTFTVRVCGLQHMDMYMDMLYMNKYMCACISRFFSRVNITVVVLPAALTQRFSGAQPLQPLHTS
jgi:hypothetical protein